MPLYTYRPDICRGMKKDQGDLRKKGTTTENITLALVLKWNPSRMEFNAIRTGYEPIEDKKGKRLAHPLATKIGNNTIRLWNKTQPDALELPPITSIRKVVVRADGKRGTRFLLGCWTGSSLDPAIDHWGNVIAGAQEKKRKMEAAADEKMARIMRRRLKRVLEEIYNSNVD